MKLTNLSALVIALMLVTAIPALAADEVTVGNFIQELAKAKNVNATEARIAVDSLRAVGVRVPEGLDLDAALTEGAVVDIARAANLRVATLNPDAPFGREQVDSFFTAFAVELGLGGGQEEDPPTTDEWEMHRHNPFTKGAGSHFVKGIRSPSEPE
jgi:hypothetical protein